MGFTSYLWDGGSGTGAMFFPNWNHPDPAKQELFRERNFRLALSHAIDRALIQKVVYFGTGEPTTGTLSGKAIEYHRTERGRDLYAQWRDLAVEYDPEGAMALAGRDRRGGPGWRRLARICPRLAPGAANGPTGRRRKCLRLGQRDREG